MNTAPPSASVACNFVAALDECAQEWLRIALAPEVTAASGVIIINCWTAQGVTAFEAVRHKFEEALPDGYELRILGSKN